MLSKNTKIKQRLKLNIIIKRQIYIFYNNYEWRTKPVVRRGENF